MAAVASPSRALLAAAFAAICVIWGSTYFGIKVGLESFDPVFFVGVRYALAAGATFALARYRGATFPGPFKRWWPVFGVGVLFIAICNGLVFFAETKLDSGFTALLITATPLWTALFAPWLSHDPAPKLAVWIGIAFGIAGTVVLLEPWKVGVVNLGAALAIEVSVIAWAIGSHWARKIGPEFDSMALSVAQMAAGAVVMLVIAGIRGKALVGPITWRAMAGLGYLVVFGSVVAFAAYFYLLEHWDATRVSSSAYINPVVAVALGWWFLDERITWSMIVGTAIVLVGVALVLYQQRHQRHG